MFCSVQTSTKFILENLDQHPHHHRHYLHPHHHCDDLFFVFECTLASTLLALDQFLHVTANFGTEPVAANPLLDSMASQMQLVGPKSSI